MTQIPQLPPHIDVQDDDLLVVRQSDNKDHKVPVAALSKGNVRYVQTIEDLRAVNGMQDGQATEIVSTGRAGLFRWQAGDLSADVASDPQMGIYVPPVGQVGSAGAWVRVYDTLDLYFFGAEQGEDVVAAIEGLSLFLTTTPHREVRFHGKYTVSRGVLLNVENAGSVDWALSLAMAPGASDEFVMSLRAMNVASSGWLHLDGGGAVNSWSTFRARYGLVCSGIQGATLPSIYINRVKYDGVIFDEHGAIGWPAPPSGHWNNTITDTPKIRARDVGGYNYGISNLPTSYTFSNPVRSGSSGVASQRTTIDVSGIPFDKFDARYNNNFFAVIKDQDGTDKTYMIKGADFSGGKLELFPWTDENVSGGEIKFFFGAAFHPLGPNGSPAKVGLLDAIRTGIAISDTALYGVEIGTIVNHFSAACIQLGNDASSISPVNSQYHLVYTEGVPRNMVSTGTGSAFIGGRSGSFAGPDPFIRCERIHAQNSVRSFEAFSNIMGLSRIKIPDSQGTAVAGLHYKGRPRNAFTDNSSTISMGPQTNPIPQTYRRNSWTVRMTDPGSLNYASGLDDFSFTAFGTGANKEPTGDFTFEPPAGWTVEGAATYTANGFSGPVTFHIYYHYAEMDIKVILK